MPTGIPPESLSQQILVGRDNLSREIGRILRVEGAGVSTGASIKSPKPYIYIYREREI